MDCSPPGSSVHGISRILDFHCYSPGSVLGWGTEIPLNYGGGMATKKKNKQPPHTKWVYGYSGKRRPPQLAFPQSIGGQRKQRERRLPPSWRWDVFPQRRSLQWPGGVRLDTRNDVLPQSQQKAPERHIINGCSAVGEGEPVLPTFSDKMKH